MSLRIGPAQQVQAAAQPLPCELRERASLPGRAARFDLACDLTGRGSLEDRLTIIDRDPLRASDVSWPELAGTHEATWIFDVNDDATTELVVIFRQPETVLIAELYDAQGDPARLEHQIDGAQVIFLNQLQPTVRMIASDGWWTRNGKINFNLDIAVDGLVEAAFDVHWALKNRVATDGFIDFIIRIRDENNDGRPDYDWRTVQHPPQLPPFTLPRTFLMVNEKDNEPPLAPVLPWPFLGGETYYLTASPLPSSDPPIQVNWESGTITTVGEFVRSRGNDGQWFVYSFEEVKQDEYSYPDFEAPFAWYDLADDNDHAPELSVRLGYFWAFSPVFLRGNYNRPINFVRYSWDQKNDGRWDYKLALLGHNEVTTTVTVDDLEMRLVDYDELPGWVLRHDWGVAIFVTSENGGVSGEGIYTWDAPVWLMEQYFTGRSDLPMPEIDLETYRGEDLRRIEPGFRGEYQLDLNGQVRLYVSAVDRRPHLLYGDRGMWNIDGRSTIHYANLDGDKYFDEWRLMVDGELVRQLNDGRDYLVLAENNIVTLAPVTTERALVELVPPRDHQGWLAFGKQVNAHLGSFEPDDFAAMLDSLGGSPSRIVGANLRDFRSQPEGFRFVLELQPGFRLEGAEQLTLEDLAPGSYVVTYDGSFSVVPLTPPEVELTVAIPPTDFSLFEPAVLQVWASNLGSEDARELKVVAEISRNGVAPIEIAEGSLALLAGEPVDTLMTWWPREAGTWEMRIQVLNTEGRMLAEQKVTLRVVESQWYNIPAIFEASTGLGHRGSVLLLLPVLALLIGLGVFLTSSATARRQDS
ncbi:hypothetical protein [Candidatus Chloroploca sp. Khr17]|uniref:hypothetical protein n=1 Tax=Candidatus Chloroploca sp. Khr17 TaxID=2496869 RepID=UPI00196A94B5|nr:hypothetical protein [Candidatus Chloroploca sp. Khr17]